MASHIVPDFLIIGAMKAGTTSLYRDLSGHPDLFLPEEKEPDILVMHADDAGAMQRDYHSLFTGARVGQLKGEASTSYTKRPDYNGVAERALRICGPKLKLIYLTRDPVKRIVSQYRHEYGLEEVTEEINTAVLQYPRYIAYSQHDWQLEPWLNAFGAQNLKVIEFERYVADRLSTVQAVCKFLEVDADRLAPLQLDRAFNANEGKLVPTGAWKRLVNSRFYQRVAKRLVPRRARELIAARVLSPAKQSHDQLRAETETELRRQLAIGEIEKRPSSEVSN